MRYDICQCGDHAFFGTAQWCVGLISPEDIGLLDHSWHARVQDRYAYIARNNYPRFLHRVILSAPPAKAVDHINGNGVDNRRYNLRLCSNTENQHNSRPRKGSSQFKGVYWNVRDRRWLARIVIDGRQKVVGRFTVETDAARAYDAAALALRGEFARVNFPSQG